MIVRPEVWRDLEESIEYTSKQMAYRTIEGALVKEFTITDVLVHTEWSMGELPLTCPKNDIPHELWFLPGQQKNELADKWGVVWQGCNPERVRELVMARAVVRHK